jgi:hypothetical protein
MKLLEGTHFLRGLEQPSRDGPRSKERVDCMLCPSDDDDGDNVHKRARMGYRLDKLQKHYKAKHKDSFTNEGRTLLNMGFSLSGAGGVDQGAPEAQRATLSSGDHETVHGHEDHQDPHLPEPATPRPAAIAELHIE